MRATRATSTIPIGTLMKNAHGQPGPWTSSPPGTELKAAAAPPAAPKMPMARLRSGPSANVCEMIASAFGAASAAPRPCAARATISTSSEPASPPSSDAPARIATPAISTFRCPVRSPTRPPSSRNPATKMP